MEEMENMTKKFVLEPKSDQNMRERIEDDHHGCKKTDSNCRAGGERGFGQVWDSPQISRRPRFGVDPLL